MPPMAHSHGAHAAPGPKTPRARRQVRILLTIIVVPFALATVAGLAVLWPARSSVPVPEAIGPQPLRAEAKVLETAPVACPGADEGQPPDCSAVTVRLQTGRFSGETVDLQ